MLAITAAKWMVSVSLGLLAAREVFHMAQRGSWGSVPLVVPIIGTIGAFWWIAGMMADTITP